MSEISDTFRLRWVYFRSGQVENHHFLFPKRVGGPSLRAVITTLATYRESLYIEVGPNYSQSPAWVPPLSQKITRFRDRILIFSALVSLRQVSPIYLVFLAKTLRFFDWWFVYLFSSRTIAFCRSTASASIGSSNYATPVNPHKKTVVLSFD